MATCRSCSGSCSLSLKLRAEHGAFWGHQSLYGNLFYHSPYYHETTLPALDRRELSLDFGWILDDEGGEMADRA